MIHIREDVTRSYSAGVVARVAVGLISLAVSLGALDLAVRVSVYHFAHHGRLFQPDRVLGWKPLPNLDLVRLNASGQRWRVQTNETGYRSPVIWQAHARKRVLVLGDSYAFGEGVNIEERFDVRMARERPGWSIINLGVMGYGTDQELIAGRDFFDGLRPGDVLILLTYSNDFYDILRSDFSCRAKPWFTFRDGKLVEHKPIGGVRERLRATFYLALLLCTSLERPAKAYSRRDLDKSAVLYEKLVHSETGFLAERGVAVVIAHHGDGILKYKLDVRDVYAKLCVGPGYWCVELDSALDAQQERSVFLPDGHWSAEGHRVVAETLSRHLGSLGI